MAFTTRKLWLDHDVVARVKPVTLRRYQGAMLTFASWALQENLTAGSPDELDDALMWYKQSERPTRSQFIVMVSALEFCVPAAKGHLHWSHAAIAGWSKRVRIRHTLPLTKRPAKLLAIQMAVRGKRRLGIGLLMQVHTGLRPSELLGLLPEHLLFPQDQGWSGTKSLPLVIALGMRHGTKVKRQQTATLSASHVELWQALWELRRQTPAGFYLFPYTLEAYRQELRACEAALGWKIGFSPHGPRAGFATDARLEGVPFVEIREAGRWQSDSSLRCYLDIIAAADVVRAMRMAGQAGRLEAAERAWPYYFQ